MVIKTIILINFIFMTFGIILIGIGFFNLYNFRKLSKIIIGAIFFAIGLILLLHAIGLIRFNF